MNFSAYLAFKNARAKDLQRIASRTRGEFTAADLAGEAILAAEYHAEKRGSDIDWTNPRDQKLILGTLVIQHVRRKNAKRKRTLSCDQQRTNHEEANAALIDAMAADETSDPLVILERREEEEIEREERVKQEAMLETYSQSVAYNIFLWHFDNIRTRAAAFLLVTPGTLRDRMTWAAKSLKVQPSLFDRIEQISKDFMPLPDRRYLLKIKSLQPAGQLRLAF